MIKGLLNTLVMTSLGAFVFFTSSDIENTFKQELVSGENPYKVINQSPDFIKRSIASLPDDVTVRALKQRRVEDMHIYKSYEESLSKLKSCLKNICDDYFQSEEVNQNYDKYAQVVISEINTRIGQLYNFTLKRGFRSHSIITTGLDFISVADEELMKNIVLLLSTQKSDIRSLNALVKISKGKHGADLRSLIILELERYAKSPSFKEKVSDQIITALSTGSSFEDSLISTELHRFINKDNYRKFNNLLTKIPNDSKVYSNLMTQIEKYESKNL